VFSAVNPVEKTLKRLKGDVAHGAGGRFVLKTVIVLKAEFQ